MKPSQGPPEEESVPHQLQEKEPAPETLIKEGQTGIHAHVEAAGAVEEQRTLTPEQIERLVWTIKVRFDRNNRKLPTLHPDVEWSQVEESLHARPDLMWSLSKMEETGGKVDVIGEDADNFLFGDTSSESPSERRNVTFDRKAEEYVRGAGEPVNGNATDLVRDWEVDFMDEEQYRALQTKGTFDSNTQSWLKTLPDISATGDAICGFRYAEDVFLVPYNARYHGEHWGFRCVLRVPKVKA